MQLYVREDSSLMCLLGNKRVIINRKEKLKRKYKAASGKWGTNSGTPRDFRQWSSAQQFTLLQCPRSLHPDNKNGPCASVLAISMTVWPMFDGQWRQVYLDCEFGSDAAGLPSCWFPGGKTGSSTGTKLTAWAKNVRNSHRETRQARLPESSKTEMHTNTQNQLSHYGILRDGLKLLWFKGCPYSKYDLCNSRHNSSV